MSLSAKQTSTRSLFSGYGPGSFYVAEDRARTVTEEHITDAGYDPVTLGGLDRARALEDLTWPLLAAMSDGAPILYCFAIPGEL